MFLAMCRQRLGQTQEARAALEAARDWQKAVARLSPSDSREFAEFVREADALLNGSLPALPADVFAH